MSDTAVASGVQTMEGSMNPARRRARLKRRLVLGSLIFFTLCIPLIAVLAPLLAPYDPAAQTISNRLKPPTAAHVFGTDQYGRDILSRLLYGARTTLSVSVVATGIAGCIGMFVGMSAGYKGGFLDDGAKLLSDVLMAFPTLLLGLMVLAVMGPGSNNLVAAASMALLPKFIRLARSVTVSIKEREYILAARSIGARDLRIILGHVLPNLKDNILTFSIVWVADVVRMEAGLSFLGIGIQPPAASWGLMIREGFSFLDASPWLALFPGMAVVIYLLLLSVLSDQFQTRFV